MSECKVVRKWFWVWDFEKEEQWLNMMAESGWVLNKVGFCRFEFIPCKPGEYAVRLEMREEDPAYISFMSEMDTEYVGRVAQWLYFRRKTADGPFELFSDLDSRMAHLNRINRVLRIITAANIAIGVGNSINPMIRAGWMNLLCVALTAYGAGRIRGKMDELNKVRQLHE